jgi:ATP-dependent RNA helicase RhlE
MPREVVALAREILENAVRVDIAPKQLTVNKVDQRVVGVANSDKRRMLVHLLREHEVSRAIVFTRTKHGANKVARQLSAAGIGTEAIHGNKSQNARQRALQRFKNGDAWVLVATDVAARGLDIEAVSHVINYELPHEPESYVHRIGRTARAGTAGVAWSLVDPSERNRLRAVERLIGLSPAEVVVRLLPQGSIGSKGIESRKKDRQPSALPDKTGVTIEPDGNGQRSGSSGRPQGDQKSDRRRRVRRRSRQQAAQASI